MPTTTTAPLAVKSCYSHIGGRLGALLMEQFIEKRWITKLDEMDRHYVLTPTGELALTEWGIDLTLIPRENKHNAGATHS